MTTTQTIDGVPRHTLRLALAGIEYLALRADDIGTSSVQLAAELRALLDAPVPFPGYPPVPEDRKLPSARPQGEPVACAHDWLDDGEYLIVCTKCGAKENHDPCWRDMASAPTDGTMVRLLVEFEEHSTEDADQAPTIGANNFDNDGENVWRFAGWCWSHDHFTEGKGTPVGWLPMLPDPICTPASTI